MAEKPGLRSRSRRFLCGVGFVITLGVAVCVGVGLFCRTPQVQLDHFLHHTPKLGISLEMVVGTISFETFFEADISCCAPRFPLTANSYKIVNSQTSFP